MNILLVTDSYPPEIRSASHLMLELAQELQKRGHNVTVITSWPQYNLDGGKIEGNVAEYTIEKGIAVIRVKTLPHHNVNYIVRGIAQLLMPLQFLWKLKKHLKTAPDAVIVYSPPLPLALLGTWYKRRGAKYLLNVQDIFPQNAIDLDLLKNKFLIKFFKKMEHFSYKTAGCVTLHSQRNCDLLKDKFPQLRNKMQLLHNWIDVEHHSNEKEKNYRHLFNLEGKVVCLFAGVIGPSQYLDVVIEAAEKLRDLNDLVFLLVGDGVEKTRLKALVREKNLWNVVFQPFVSREDYPALVKSCDIGLISLSHRNTTPVVPGKLLGYMASGLPVAAFLNAASDGHEIIAQAQCGYSTFSDQVDNVVGAIRNLYDNRDRLSELGENGRAYARQHFSQENCINHLETLLENS